ncbi:MAG: hypothetical protein CMQ43_07950 [Gammaproteobacteria bacterium]|nr:hypothetical protein [Gammaproteobacteria bacterium]|tara:strand:+ start:670 stop:1257 length:588 start_codon:yes stop_codon:yes gene_type:complete
MNLLAAAWILLQPVAPAADAGCLDAAAADPVAARVVARLAAELSAPPARVLACPDGRWEVRWPNYQQHGDWRKSARGHCRSRPGPDGVVLDRCRVAIDAHHPGLPHPIRLGHDLPLSRVREVVDVLAGGLPPDQRIWQLDFTTVRDGGAWSEEHYGYEAQTVRAGGGSGHVLRVYRDCAPSPCVWAWRKISEWVS